MDRLVRKRQEKGSKQGKRGRGDKGEGDPVQLKDKGDAARCDACHVHMRVPVRIHACMSSEMDSKWLVQEKMGEGHGCETQRECMCVWWEEGVGGSGEEHECGWLKKEVNVFLR